MTTKEYAEEYMNIYKEAVKFDSDISAETLAELAKDKNALVRRDVAGNLNASVETLAELAKDKNALVRRNVAGNPNTSVETLAELAKDKNALVRRDVVHNPNTSAAMLAELVKDKDELVRINVAGNPNTSVEVLTELAKDESELIRWGVIDNPNTPVKILAELERDKYEFIAELARSAKKKENIDNQLNKEDMNEKIYVGNSYKTVTEKGTFYNFEVSKEAIEKIDGAGKRNEIYLAIEPKKEVQEKHPTHSVYVGDKHSKRELQLVVSKDELLKAPVDAYGNIKAFAASREKIGADLSNYSVALEQKDPETDKYQFVGRGYDESTKFGETRVVGVAFKTEFGQDGADGKVYNVNLDANKVSKLTMNEYGDARLGIVPYAEKVLNPDGSTTEQTRYLVTEATSVTKGVEATIAVHVSNPEGKEYPTLSSCAIHKVGENEVYKLVVQDRKSESIGKDCADLTVSENKYTPEMKNLSEAERKAALGEKNYIGKGWTNDPDKIRIDKREDLTPKGLTAAIDNNHTVKVIAILNAQPTLVRESHLKQIEARQKDSNLKTSNVLVEKVKQTFDSFATKQKKSNGHKIK
ncbi:MAG: HEAT repeat domain-containing protein [Bacteroidales bacterium]|jgi:hypothetical protein|nr:HEAT repeat domain-containing protein [Bacteroidales bacterium]